MTTALETIPVQTIDGRPASLADHAGKVRLVVNVASKCGYTPQYAGLEKLYRAYKDRGLAILGFPANEFGRQEPGTDAQIQEFCSTQYDVTFPMFSKIVVKGEGQHPLYAALTQALPEKSGDVSWNFEKFLISRQGEVVERFAPKVEPGSPELAAAIERALG